MEREECNDEAEQGMALAELAETASQICTHLP